jgi:hypothetical protein
MMMEAKEARYLDIDRSAAFADISAWCLSKRQTNRLLVAVRPAIDVNDRVSFDPQIFDSVAAIFGQNIIRVVPARAWPGVRLIEGTGKVYVISFDSIVQRRMIETQEYLSGWKQANTPPLPEDICLYREGDAWPTLVSVTLDGDAWLLNEEPNPGFAHVPAIALPIDLIPPSPSFIVENSDLPPPP